MRATASRSTSRVGLIRQGLDPSWSDPRFGFATAVGTAAFWGLVAGWWMPRGPLTTAQALWSIALGLLVGALAGLVTRSRWAMLAAPVTFMIVFELMRIGLVGPTVDRIRFSTYGFLALGVGRIFHGLVALVPMVWAAALGAGYARQLDIGGRPADHPRRQLVGR
jgi:proline iminopeptidase